MPSKKQLAIILSKLLQFDNPKVVLEQYSTDPEVAAEILWKAMMNEDITGKTIADLGSGPGIFGIGAAILGAKKVYFVDKDKDAIETTKQNLLSLKEEIKDCKIDVLCLDVSLFNEKVDVVLMNPPFGTKVKHHDRIFLSRAFEISKVIYSIHKITSRNFIEQFCKDEHFKVDYVIPFSMKLRKEMNHHKKPAVFVDVGLWRLGKEF